MSVHSARFIITETAQSTRRAYARWCAAPRVGTCPAASDRPPDDANDGFQNEHCFRRHP